MEQDAFWQLLDPVGKDRFLSDYWDQAAVHIPGSTAKFQDLPGIEEIPSLVAGTMTADGWKMPDVTVHGSFVDQGAVVRDLGAVPSSMLASLYNAGVSLCFPRLGADDPRIGRYLQTIRHSLAYPGEIILTGYLTPPRSGSELHFDSQHGFLLQIAGEKRWRVSSTPSVSAPPSNMSAAALDEPAVQELLRRKDLRVKRPEELEFEEVQLRPGDVLYLPPGTWHEPRTIGRSFHYTLTLFPVSIAQILSSMLRTVLTRRTDWRRDLRFTGGVETSEERMLATIAESLELLGAEMSSLSPETVLRRSLPRRARDSSDSSLTPIGSP